MLIEVVETVRVDASKKVAVSIMSTMVVLNSSTVVRKVNQSVTVSVT